MPWSIAWQLAMTGPAGFYRSQGGQAEQHFATEVTSGDRVARRIIELAAPSLRALPSVTVTDVGAASGTLVSQLIRLWPTDLPEVTAWRGIDVRAKPERLDPRIEWIVADVTAVDVEIEPSPGLVIAHELLDDIACDIVEPDEDGDLRLVLVDPVTGMEMIGPSLRDSPACAALGIDGATLLTWCEDWWQRRQPTARIEVGASRDAAWRSVSSIVSDGAAIAVDYSHLRVEREAGRWDGGTLAAYAHGRPARPIPDGGCNITAHVALDSCAAASPGIRSELLNDKDDFRWLVQRIAPVAGTMAT